MSKDWTQEELKAASIAMKAAGDLGYEDFCDNTEQKHFHSLLQRRR